jgi:predicted enzyme related to lactoylglutathione lyase
MKSNVSPNAIVHFDVSGPDEEPLREFYGGLFGWELNSPGPGYTLLGTPSGSPDGAIVESEEAALTVGIAVADLDAALAAATERGGSVVMPATDNGWVTKAQVSDPAGNLVTLIQA